MSLLLYNFGHIHSFCLYHELCNILCSSDENSILFHIKIVVM